MNWFYAEDNHQRGPVSEVELQQLVASGKITDATLVWRDGMAQWQPYGQVRGAAAATPGLPPQPPATTLGFTPMNSDAGRSNALNRVNGPGIGLIVTAVLGFVGSLFNLAQIAIGTSAIPIPTEVDPQLRQILEMMQGSSVWMIAISTIFGVALNAVTLMGGLKMRKLQSHGLCMAAGIIAVIPCFTCCCIGLPIGIWALVVMNSADVKPYFD